LQLEFDRFIIFANGIVSAPQISQYYSLTVTVFDFPYYLLPFEFGTAVYSMIIASRAIIC